MENQNNSRNEESKSSLKLKLLLSNNIPVSVRENLVDTDLFSFSQNQSDTDFLINQNNKEIDFLTQSGNKVLSLTEKSLNCRLSNQPQKLITLLKLFQKSQNNASKIDRGFLSKLNKLIQKDEILSLKRSLTLNHRSESRVVDILETIGESTYVSRYTSFQVLIHKKGFSTARSYSYRAGSEILKTYFRTQDFNTAYKIIKKSKNKSFDRSNIQIEELNLVGKFLASSIEVSDYNIIVILSRNDFLPAQDDEYSLFDQFTETITSFLAQAIKNDQISKRRRDITECLNFFPLSLLVQNEQGKNIFSQGNIDPEDSKSIIQQKVLDNGISFTISNTSQNITSNIQHYKRISLLGDLLNTLRHELNNPLFGIKLSSELMAEDYEDPEIKETLEAIATNSSRCQAIIKNFSNLFEDDQNLRETNISQLIEETFVLAKSETRQVLKEMNFDKDIVITTNASILSQVLFNLIINSSQALLESSTSVKKLRIEVIKHRSEIEITVSDNGPGIPEEIKKDIFNNFFTTKNNGNGLGLPICRSLSKKINGRINLNPKEYTNLGGASFSIFLPLNIKS